MALRKPRAIRSQSGRPFRRIRIANNHNNPADIPGQSWATPAKNLLTMSSHPAEVELREESATWIARNEVTHIHAFPLKCHIRGSNPRPLRRKPRQSRNIQQRHLSIYSIFTTHRARNKRDKQNPQIRISLISYGPYGME